MTHITPTGYINLVTENFSSPVGVPAGTASVASVFIDSDTWGSAAVVMQWTMDEEEWIDFDPPVTLSGTYRGRRGIPVGGVRQIRLRVDTGDSSAASNAPFYLTVQAGSVGGPSTTYASTSGSLADAALTTILGPPAAGETYRLRCGTILNPNAVSRTVTVSGNDGSARSRWVVALAQNEVLQLPAIHLDAPTKTLRAQLDGVPAAGVVYWLDYEVIR